MNFASSRANLILVMYGSSFISMSVACVRACCSDHTVTLQLPYNDASCPSLTSVFQSHPDGTID